MKSPLRSLGKILFLLLVLVFLTVGGVLAWFTSWRADRMASLNGASEIIQTKYGPVECVIRGEGPVVLVFHGSPGGYDQAMLFGSRLLEKGFTVVAPSRPGYLRTPLSSGLLPGQQGDLFAAILDSMGERSAAVIGVSGGAPAAIEFVLDHPNRVWAFALIGGITKKVDPWMRNQFPHPGNVVLEGLTGDIGSWLAVEMAQNDPRQMLEKTLAAEDAGDGTSRYLVVKATMKDPSQVEWFRNLISTFAPLSPRESGTRNDMVNQNALPDYPFQKISAPTLIIHGAKDKGAPLADAQAVAARIPGSQFLAVDGVGQLVFLGPKGNEAQDNLINFLKQHSGGQGGP
jgi:pimeloyl-ACP methyl ester carboxylesterase